MSHLSKTSMLPCKQSCRQKIFSIAFIEKMTRAAETKNGNRRWSRRWAPCLLETCIRKIVVWKHHLRQIMFPICNFCFQLVFPITDVCFQRTFYVSNIQGARLCQKFCQQHFKLVTKIDVGDYYRKIMLNSYAIKDLLNEPRNWCFRPRLEVSFLREPFFFLPFRFGIAEIVSAKLSDIPANFFAWFILVCIDGTG